MFLLPTSQCRTTPLWGRGSSLVVVVVVVVVVRARERSGTPRSWSASWSFGAQGAGAVEAPQEEARGGGMYCKPCRERRGRLLLI